MWLGYHFRGQKVKGQLARGHIVAASRTAWLVVIISSAKGVMFSSVSVCLSINGITKNYWSNLLWNFIIVGQNTGTYRLDIEWLWRKIDWLSTGLQEPAKIVTIRTAVRRSWPICAFIVRIKVSRP